jgi:alpha-glucosidase
VLSNHDVQRHVTRYGGGEIGLRRARAAALLMLALPGSAYVYQGEELGLPEVLDLPEEFLTDPQRGSGEDRGRDGCRVPIPWSGTEPPFGFGTAGSWLPMPPAWKDLTVAAQTADPASTLELYRTALRIRRDHEGLGDGTLHWLDDSDTLHFARDHGFHCLVNLGTEGVTVTLDGAPLLASGALQRQNGHLVLPPDVTLWWQARTSPKPPEDPRDGAVAS